MHSFTTIISFAVIIKNFNYMKSHATFYMWWLDVYTTIQLTKVQDAFYNTAYKTTAFSV